jgi:hypothetical protein
LIAFVNQNFFLWLQATIKDMITNTNNPPF